MFNTKRFITGGIIALVIGASIFAGVGVGIASADSPATGYFTEVSGLGSETNAIEVMEYQEGGENSKAHKFVGVDGLSMQMEVIEYQNGDDPLTRKRPGR